MNHFSTNYVRQGSQWSLLLLFTLITLGLSSIPACKHDPVGGPVDPIDTMDMHPCDPDTVYFSTDVLPIILSSCGMELCHDAVTKTEGVEITSYETLIASNIVVPFEPDSSMMYQLMTETDLTEVMPPNPRGPISDNNIEVIRKWIEQGALNNSCNPDTTCEIIDPVSYSQEIFPIVDKYCVGCHSGNNPWGGLFLRNYDEIKVVVDDGRLIGSIRREVGFAWMPRNQDKLADCDIRKFEEWIEAGAPNN